MGSKCSHQHSSCTDCNCFINDNQIKNTQIIRYATSKWEWSTNHDMALIDGLSELLYIPKEILYLIKDHSYHSSHIYYITKPIIQSEKYYNNQSQLLKKQLCPNWYSKQLHHNTQSLLIAVHVSSLVHLDHTDSV